MITDSRQAEFTCKNPDELIEIGKKILEFAEDLKVWTFHGEMGAGKTTLIKAICEVLGVTDNVTSPTFSLVNEYITQKGDSVFHFDFYRIKDESEALDIGIEEYIYSDSCCFIEWPSKIENLLDGEQLEIIIEQEESHRRIQLRKK